ncbi:unnamed protein product [Amoebophrya sp. A25]|nr:unnamed protein product [Amoebophrya sp. A25]|eukprot:GSA25T00000218001.1
MIVRLPHRLRHFHASHADEENYNDVVNEETTSSVEDVHAHVAVEDAYVAACDNTPAPRQRLRFEAHSQSRGAAKSPKPKPSLVSRSEQEGSGENAKRKKKSPSRR